jgi:hypothetical protein
MEGAAALFESMKRAWETVDLIDLGLCGLYGVEL